MPQLSAGATHPWSDIDLGKLLEFAVRDHFPKGRLIGVQNQPAENLYIVERGHVLLSRTDDQGDDYALYLLGPGQLFGEGALHPEGCWLVSVHPVTDCTAYVLPAAHLPRLFQHYPELARCILNLVSLRLERAHRRIDVIRVSDARERLLRLLQAMADYHGHSGGEEVWLPLPLTQAELGSIACLARETVARVLATLEEDGLVRREGRKGVWLRVPSASGATGSQS